MQLVIGTIGAAHGLRGELAVHLRTDNPVERFAVGAVLSTDPAAAGPLTVTRSRTQVDRWFITFREVTSRTVAEGLRGVALVVDVGSSDDGDAWYPHELAGLRVELVDGSVIGEVIGLEALPAQDSLVIRENSGARTLVPFVKKIVPVVDVAGGRVVLDPPHGLLAGDDDVDVEA